MNAYAISDIHGCSQTFRALLARLQLTTNDKLFLLGDFVNKGPDAKGVLDTVFDLRQKGYDLHCLRGNHDDILLEMPTNGEYQQHKERYGAQYTLQSFGVARAQDIPSVYLDFLDSLPTYLIWNDYIFVHAGFSFARQDPLGDTYPHTRIREWYDQIDYAWLGDRWIIHGHDQQTMQKIEQQLQRLPQQQVLNIDAGCVSVWEAGKGHLCAFDLVTHRCIFQGYVENDW